MEYQDITKTGPVGLKGLNYTGPSQESENYKISGYKGYMGVGSADPSSITIPKHRDLNDPLAYLGTSKYDDISAGMEGETNLNETRFENQSTLDAMGNAVVKMLGTAASTIVGGASLIFSGIPTAIREKRWSGLWDNDVTQALTEAEDWMEDNFKIYQSQEQKEASWLSAANLTSASFWGDDVIKNAGFMLGAAASGGMFSGGLGMFSRALGLASKATNSSKVTSAILGSLFSAAGEGSVEARNLYNDTKELEYQRLDDALNKEAQQAIDRYEATKGTLVQGADGSYYDPAYVELQRAQEDIVRKREVGREEINKAAREAGNLDMALNIPILTLSNLITLGKGFSKSFSNAAKLDRAINRAEGSNLVSGVNRSKKELSEYYRALRNGEEVTPVTSTLKNTKWGKTRTALTPIITEGSEEMNQQWASSFSGYYKAHKEDPNDYWKAQLDPAAQQETLSVIDAVSKGFLDSWGDFDQWEQFLVGGLTGAIGMPMPTKAFKQDKTKKKYDPRRYFSWEGGSFQNVRDFKKKLENANTLNESLNSRLKDPKFWERMGGLTAHSYFQTSMDEAVANNDIKAYKDNEEKQFVRDLNAFVRAGKLQDFLDIIDAGTLNLSDEDIQDLIKRNTVKVTQEQDAQNQRNILDEKYRNLEEELQKERSAGNESRANAILSEMVQNRAEHDNVVGEEKSIGLYTDENGNLTKNFDEIRQELQRNNEEIKRRVGEYTESLEKINNISRGNLTADQVGNLAYLDYMDKAARTRANKILDRYSIPNSFILKPLKGETPRVIETVLKLPEGSITTNDNNTVTVNISSLPTERKRDLYLEYGLGHDQESGLKNATNLLSDNEPATSIAFQDIIDATKLLMDSRKYMSTFEDYMKNPYKVDEKKSKEEKRTDKEIKNASIDEKSVPELVEDIDNGNFEFNEDDFDFTEEDLAILGTKDEENNPNIQRKQKLKSAYDIAKTKSEISRRVAGTDSSNDIENMLNASSQSAESVDELLDLDTEAFNDKENLSVTEDEKNLIEAINNPELSQEEINEALEALDESRQRRIDEIKEILQEIKEELKEGRDLLEDIPNGKTVKVWKDDTTSKDPTDRTEPVNREESVNKPDTSEEDIPTPDISNISNIPSEEVSSQDTSTRGHWKTNTTEYPIHKQDGNKPYYNQIKDPKKQAIYKEIYKFLENSGVFTRIKNNEIKVGQKIRFAISKTLTSSLKKLGGEHTVLLIVDENNNIIGDLASPYDTNTFGGFPYLADLYNKAVDNYNKNQGNTEGDLVILPNVESTISRPYIGRPLYEEDTSNRHTLNDIAQEKSFKIGLSMSTGDNPRMIMTAGKRKSQGLSSEDISIMRPQSALAGQPFLLIETSDPNRRWYPIPITMPTYSANSNAKLAQIVNSYIRQLSDITNFLTREEQLKWANGLKDLLGVGEVYFTVNQILYGDNTKGYDIVFRVKKRKSDTSWETVYRGDSIAGDPSTNIMEALSSLKISYQISRKYINSTFNGQDYNGLIGELANTNLAIGALHTVNDFYSINPIQDGKEKKAAPIKDVNKNAENKALSNRENTFVSTNIIPDQQNVDRSKTDSEYYYIKESDGKYHKYERVHKVLPSNSNNTSSGSSLELRTGSTIDTIVRDFFNTGETVKPDTMSEEAYQSVLNYLNSLSKWLKENGWSVYANNIVLYNKYPDGRRIAGEVDLLLIDNKGNYYIYDVKTSKNPFNGDSFEGIHSNWGQIMSTKEYYTLQVSSYAKLLNDRFGKKVKGIAIVSFNITYDSNDNVVSVTKVPNIALPITNVDSYFSNNSQPAEPQSTSKTSEPNTDTTVLLDNMKNNRMFKTKKWQNRLSRLNEDNIKGLSKVAKKAPILKRTIDFLDAKIKDTMSDEELNNLVAEQLRPKNREVSTSNLTGEQESLLNKELEVIERLLPQLSEEDRIRIVETTIKIPNGEAWGQFKDGIITIYKSAAKGTLYHESFHFVFNSLMTGEEIENAYKSAEKQWGKLSPIELEERMAEDFRRYMQNEETFVGRLKSLWSKLKALLNHFNNNWNYLDRVYSDIATGRYANRETSGIQTTVKYNKVPSVADIQRRVDSLVNNPYIHHSLVSRNKAWGKLKNSLEEDGIIMKGYRRGSTWIVASVRSKAEIDSTAISVYHNQKLAYNNLSQERKDYLQERGISINEYNKMTLLEKEILFECMY